MKHRPLRVGNLIRDELGALILRELEFGSALVTITEVEVDDRLEAAIVKISTIPTERAAEALRLLGDNERRLQRLLHYKINIKPMPRIRFEHDPGPDKAARIEKHLLGGN